MWGWVTCLPLLFEVWGRRDRRREGEREGRKTRRERKERGRKKDKNVWGWKEVGEGALSNFAILKCKQIALGKISLNLVRVIHFHFIINFQGIFAL